PRILRVLATAYSRVGDVQGRPLQPNLGDTAGALASYRKAEAILTRLAARETEGILLQHERIDLSNRIGAVLEAGGKVEEALGVYSRALAQSERIASRQPANTRALMETGVLSETLARILATRNPAKADSYSEKGVAAFESLLTGAPTNPG